MKFSAIDISDTLIRLVVLERLRSGWRLPVRAEISVPANYIIDGEIKQPSEVCALLKKLIDAAGLKERTVAVALPEKHTFIKMVSSDNNQAMSTERVAELITQHVPYQLNEVYWDVYDTGRRNSMQQAQWLVGLAPKNIVDDYLNLLTDAGLRPTNIEIESLAVTRAVLGPQPPVDTRIIIDLGRTRSDLIMVDNGIVQFTSTLRYAGRELNRFISDELGVDDRQAEKAKYLFGLDPKRGQGVLQKILSPHIKKIADAATVAETFYHDHFIDHRPVSCIQLTGSGTLLRMIDAELAKHLPHQIIIKPSWVFQQLKSSDRNLPDEMGYTYTTALGLAMLSCLNH